MTIKNKNAFFHFEILEKFTAGIVLLGTEIKSIRKGKVSFNDAFCLINKGEIFIKNLFISPYEFDTSNTNNPLRERKLLLNQKELNAIEKKMKEKGFTVIPLSVFINKQGFAKVDIAIARGKNTHDKRESIKKREAEREIKFLK